MVVFIKYVYIILYPLIHVKFFLNFLDFLYILAIADHNICCIIQNLRFTNKFNHVQSVLRLLFRL